MNRIETIEDLMEWAKEINSGVTVARKCDLQDVYAHSKQSDIDRLFLDDGTDRRLVLCSVYNTMAYGEVERLLKVRGKSLLNKMIREEQDSLDRQYSELSSRESTFESAKKHIYKRIADLNTEKANLQKQNSRFRELYHKEQKRANLNEKDAKRYQQIKSLLA